jgi:4-hydroxythreonine-4-phosphate dehydrogenase
MSASKPLAITMGDPAGIGPEIIVKAFQEDPALTQGCLVVGDVPTLQRAAALVQPPGGQPLPLAVLASVADLAGAPAARIPVLPVDSLSQPPVPFGRISARAGQLAGQCVVWAAQAALRGELAALVTAPLHKEALAAAGAPFDAFPGHTELLQAQAAEFLGIPVAQLPVRMMLANEELRTVLVSIHLALRDALDAVTYTQVLETLRITHQALAKLLGRPPRIAVAGLNPHAGEGGLFGREEIDTIAPAIAQAQREGWLVQGPFPPDTVFMRARAKPGQAREFDVVVAMYHDQGLIPVKYLGVEQGVNVTLGLPLVRTSPDHGTAFDLAGTGRADASSLKAAIRLARQISH